MNIIGSTALDLLSTPISRLLILSPTESTIYSLALGGFNDNLKKLRTQRNGIVGVEYKSKRYWIYSDGHNYLRVYDKKLIANTFKEYFYPEMVHLTDKEDNCIYEVSAFFQKYSQIRYLSFSILNRRASIKLDYE